MSSAISNFSAYPAFCIPFIIISNASLFDLISLGANAPSYPTPVEYPFSSKIF